MMPADDFLNDARHWVKVTTEAAMELLDQSVHLMELNDFRHAHGNFTGAPEDMHDLQAQLANVISHTINAQVSIDAEIKRRRSRSLCTVYSMERLLCERAVKELAQGGIKVAEPFDGGTPFEGVTHLSDFRSRKH